MEAHYMCIIDDSVTNQLTGYSYSSVSSSICYAEYPSLCVKESEAIARHSAGNSGGTEHFSQEGLQQQLKVSS